jgi:energy-coupling factor transporter ATP-binding protein EcfA2
MPGRGRGGSAMAQEQSVLPKVSDLKELVNQPVQIVEHTRWTTARDTALALIIGGPSLVLLVGPAGSGKTTLLRSIARLLGERGRTTCLLDFGDSQSDVGAADVVLVDEADRMSAARFDELSRRGNRSVVLAALPSRAERLRRYPGVTVLRLAPLSSDQACAFVAARLAQLGLPTGCLTESAWARLIAHSQGVPRLLIASLGLALFIAAEDGAERVTEAHVEEAIEMRGGDGEGGGAELPLRRKPEPAREEMPGFLAAGVSTGPLPRRARGRAKLVTALTAAGLFAAAAVLLLSPGADHHGQTPPATRPEALAPAATGGSAPVLAKPDVANTKAPAPAESAPQAGSTAPAASTTLLTPASPLGVAAEPSAGVAPQSETPAPAPAVPAEAAPDLPAGAMVHVILTYPRGDAAAQQRGMALAQELRSDGFGVGDPFPATPRESKRGISYFFAQDEDAAAAIERRLGGDYGSARLVRLPTNAGLPRPGTIEIGVGSD